MKKILAIAVATAIAAPAMADMTIGGTVAAGYAYSDTNTDGDAGFGIDTASIAISGSTTTDSGLAVAASMGAGGLQRTNNVTGENATLSIAGDFGKVLFANTEAGSGLVGLGGAGAPVEDLTEEVLNGRSAATSGNSLTYYAPAMGAVSVFAGMADVGDAAIGSGQDAEQLYFGATVKAGAATIKADYADYTYSDVSRVRVSGNMDLGSVVLGAGFENKDYSTYDRKESIVSVKVPMGATTLGLAYANSDDGTGTASEANGWSAGVSQVLGGGVTVSAKHTVYEQAGVEKSKGAVLVTMAF